MNVVHQKKTQRFRKLMPILEQEAQLPQRDSASATHVFLGSLTDRALH